MREIMKYARPLPGGHFLAEISPDIDEAVNEALARAQRGHAVEVIRELEAMLADHPRSHNLYFGIGTAHTCLGRHKEAIAWFDKAIAIFPHCIEALINRATAYQKLGDFSNAVRAHRKVVESGDPHDPDVARSRKFLDDVNGMLRAKHDGISLDAFLKSSDEFAKAFECMERGEWEKAVKGFKEALKVNPVNVPTHGNLGISLANMGRKAEALASLDRALELNPNYEPALTNRAHVVEMVEGATPTNFIFQSVNTSLDRR